VSRASAAPDGALDRYEALLAHAELELELAGAAELDRLVELAPRWEQLIAALEDPPPPAAGELIERARLIHDRSRVELIRVRELLQSELAVVRRAREAAAGYGGPGPAGATLERSA
jgi:hypothetical protein